MLPSAMPRWALFAFISLLVGLVLALSPQPKAEAQAAFVEGKDYVVIANPVRTINPKKIEVTEVFWYGCGHCNNFRPVFEEWKGQLAEDVYTQHSPAIWRKNMATHAKIFYTAKALKVQEKIHKNVFDAIHLQKKKLVSQKEIYGLFSEVGVSKEKFDKTFKSFGVNSMVQQADARARGYGVTGTPELIINGKYRVSPSMARSQARMLKVAEFLIAKERESLASKS